MADATRWHEHPHVRTGDQLSLGERAGDQLKRWFGSWPFFFLLNSFIFGWMILSLLHVITFDPMPFILLNLFLSWLAAQQGAALQIAANRGDRIASETALSTYRNSQEILGELRKVAHARQRHCPGCGCDDSETIRTLAAG